jgi:hypothetical protein
MSNWPGRKFWCFRALSGLDHQVTRAETAPPQAAVASRIQPALPVGSHRLGQGGQEVPAGERVQRGDGLVEQQQPGPFGQGQGQR